MVLKFPGTPRFQTDYLLKLEKNANILDEHPGIYFSCTQVIIFNLYFQSIAGNII